MERQSRSEGAEILNALAKLGDANRLSQACRKNDRKQTGSATNRARISLLLLKTSV
jgi:hypothetical protein